MRSELLVRAAALPAALALLLGSAACGGSPPAPSSAAGERPAAAATPTAAPSPPLRTEGVLGAAPSAAPVAAGDVATTSSGDHAGVPVGTGVAYAIPDLALPEALLPAGHDPVSDLGQYRLQPSVPGQACSSRPPFNVAGRQWTWIGSGRASVTVVVTGWRAGRGSAAFDDVVQDAGTCRFMDDVRSVPASVASAQQAWVASATTSTGLSPTYGAARVGDLLVGVEVLEPPSDGPALVADLLGAVADAMLASGIPAATAS